MVVGWDRVVQGGNAWLVTDAQLLVLCWSQLHCVALLQEGAK